MSEHARQFGMKQSARESSALECVSVEVVPEAVLVGEEDQDEPRVLEIAEQVEQVQQVDASEGDGDGMGVVPDAPVTVVRKKRNSLIFSVIMLSILLVIASFNVFGEVYDNDAWFILANGEYVLEHGFPYENPWSIHEGLGFVMQQWLPSVINCLIYHAAGFPGIGIYVVALFLALVISLFILGRLLRENDYGSEFVLFWIIVASLPIISYSSIRPHLYSMIAFVWVVYFCEKYRRSSKLKYLIPLPLIAALHSNCQAALAPFDIAIVFLYSIPILPAGLNNWFAKRGIFFCRSNYKHAPVFFAAVISAIALAVNPYGIEAATYIFNSFSSANEQAYISEMNPMSIEQGSTTVVTLVVIALVFICVGKRGLKDINFPLLILALVGAAMAFMYIRNKWLATLFGFMYIAWATSNFGMRPKAPEKVARIVAGIVLVITLVICGFGFSKGIATLEQYPLDDDKTPVSAMDYLDKKGLSKETTTVFTFFNAGGYIEYRGYKVNMDPRPELWNSRITGADFNYYTEYLDMARGDTYVDDYIQEYDFDVCIVPSNNNAINFLAGNRDYVEIASGDDYRAFAKRSLIMTKIS